MTHASDKNRRCVFCRSDGPLSGEHVLPVWLDQAAKARGSKGWTSWGTTGAERRHKKLDGVVNRVCKSCNNGWMSQLEAASKPILLPMIFGESGVVMSAEQQTIVAAWAFKTMLTADYMGADRVVPSSAYGRFYDEQLRPISDAVVWIAAYRGDDYRLASTIYTAVDVMPSMHFEGGNLRIRIGSRTSVICTIEAGCLLLQISLGGLVVGPYGNLEGAFFDRIWPKQKKESLAWPTENRALDDVRRKQFALRFYGGERGAEF
jgi:hypothetical protein